MCIKEMVEKEVGLVIDEVSFFFANEKAKEKHARIFESTKNELVKEDWYLATLIKEALVNDAFMRLAGGYNG